MKKTYLIIAVLFVLSVMNFVITMNHISSEKTEQSMVDDALSSEAISLTSSFHRSDVLRGGSSCARVIEIWNDAGAVVSDENDFTEENDGKVVTKIWPVFIAPDGTNVDFENYPTTISVHKDNQPVSNPAPYIEAASVIPNPTPVKVTSYWDWVWEWKPKGGRYMKWYVVGVKDCSAGGE